MKERLVSIPQEFLYSHIKDAIISRKNRKARKIGTVRDIDRFSEPSYIRVIFDFGYVDIHILSQNGKMSRIRYNFDFRRVKYAFIGIVLIISIYLIVSYFLLLPYFPIISFFSIFERNLSGWILLTSFLTLYISLFLYYKRKFSEQFEHLLHEIEMEYKHETEKK